MTVHVPFVGQGDIRVKFELGEEKRLAIIFTVRVIVHLHNMCVCLLYRIVLVGRPLRLEALHEHAQQCFPGHKFTMYFSNSEVS